MKLSKKITKLSLIGLSSSLALTSTANAGWTSDVIDDGLLNVSPSGTVTEVSGGKIQNRSFYTTSVYFRFPAAASSPEPFWAFSEPKIQVGCSGINIKGMFMKLAGLDRIEETLKNAGASLGWGIVVGLIYSLPGIASSFKMLNDWAKKIQQLMANACQSGIAMGKWASKKSGIDDGLKKLSELPDDAVQKAVDSDTGKAIKGFFSDMGSHFTDDMVFKTDAITPGPTPDQIKEFYADILSSSLVTQSVATNILGDILQRTSSSNGTNFQNLAKRIFGPGYEGTLQSEGAISGDLYLSIDDCLSLSDNQATDGTGHACLTANDFLSGNLVNGLSEEDKQHISHAIMSLILYENIGFDVAIKTDESLKKLIKAVSDKIKDAQGTSTMTDTERIKLNKIITGETDSLTYSMTTNIDNPGLLAKNLIDYILKGGTDPQQALRLMHYFDTNVNGVGFKLVLTRTKTNEPNRYLIYMIPLGIYNGIKAISVDLTLKGAKERSQILFSKIVETGDYASAKSIAKIDNFVPDIFNKLAIIQKTPGGFHNVAGTGNSGLLDTLSNYNASKTAQALGSTLLSAQTTKVRPNYFFFDGSLKETGDITDPPTERANLIDSLYTAGITATSEKISAFSKSIDETIKKQNYTTNLRELNALFDKIKKDNLSRSINKINN